MARGQVHVLLVVVAVIVGILVVGRFRWDDSYITYRMAENIAHGHGWTFNPGHPGEDAATGALWTMLLAGFAWLHIGIVGAAEVLTVIFQAGAAILIFETFVLLGSRRAGIFVAVLIAGSEFLAINVGMELPLAILFTSATLYLVERHQLGWSGVVGALAMLTRGDFALPVVFIALGVAIRWRHQALRFLWGAGSVLLPWLLIAALWIGHILPDTLTAKVDQGRSGLWGGQGTYMNTLRHLPDIPPLGGGHMKIWLYLIAGLAIVGVPVLLARRRYWVLLPLVSSAILYVVAYGYILKVPAYPWYYTFPGVVIIVLAGIALDAIAGLVRSFGTVVAVGGLLAITIVSCAGTPAAFPRLRSYADAARWLDSQVPKDRSIAAAEIGVIGWYNPTRPVIDYLGLTSPAAAAAMGRRDMLWWVSHETPDYWMTLSGPTFAADLPLLEAPWFPKAFRMVWRDTYVVIYERVAPIPSQK